MKPILICLLLVFSTIAGSAVPADTTFHSRDLMTWKYISGGMRIYYDPLSRPELQSPATLTLNEYPGIRIPLERTPYFHYQFFSITNDGADTIRYYLFQSKGAKLELFETDSTGNPGAGIHVIFIKSTILYQPIFPFIVPPGKTFHYGVRIEPIRDPFYRIQLYLIPTWQTSQFFTLLAGTNWDLSTENEIVCGMMLMMLLYILIKYWQIRSPVYFFYAGYVFFLFMFFLLREIAFWNKSLSGSEFYYAYLEQMVQIAAYALYFPFAQRFLNTRVIVPKMHRWMNRIVLVLLIYMVINLILLYFPQAMLFRWWLWDAMRVFLLVAEFIIAVVLLRSKSPYIRYLVIGSALLAFFAMISMVLDEDWIKDWPIGLNHGVTYFYFGVISEVLFFSSVLGYKHRMDELQKVQAEEALKREAQRYELQQYRLIMEALEGERSRIAKDLHDGLGGMLSGIKFSLGNIKARLLMNHDQDALYARALDQLGSSIQELRRVAHDMMPERLAEQGLPTAFREYCAVLASMEILKIDFQSIGEEKRLEAYRELIIYRILQELTTNVLRHAGASALIVQLVYDQQLLTITVEDDGHGFDPETVFKKTGIGLANVKSRVEFMRGKLSINSADTGTSMYIEIPI